MKPILATIRRYPVRGMSGQELPAVELTAGQALPLDRRYGLLHGTAALSPDQEGWRPGSDFFTLDRTEKLAHLESEFDEETHGLIVRRGGRQVSRGRLDQPMGRMLLEQFFAAYLAGLVPGTPKLAEARGGSFSEHREAPVSLVNLASLRDLEERVAKQPVDPLRLRANLCLDGLEPWAERQWIGRRLTVGDAVLELVAPMEYRAGAEVNPASGTRDLNLLPILERGYGHSEVGVYARVVQSGRIACGDPVTLD